MFTGWFTEPGECQIGRDLMPGNVLTSSGNQPVEKAIQTQQTPGTPSQIDVSEVAESLEPNTLHFDWDGLFRSALKKFRNGR
jgi:hypothetical protein